VTFPVLSYRVALEVPDYPYEWFPITHLYDPDLPLFPTYSFHVLDPSLPSGKRPAPTNRAYGYVEAVLRRPEGGARVMVICNRKLVGTNDALLS
jgi:hypothetical protein